MYNRLVIGKGVCWKMRNISQCTNVKKYILEYLEYFNYLYKNIQLYNIVRQWLWKVTSVLKCPN